MKDDKDKPVIGSKEYEEETKKLAEKMMAGFIAAGGANFEETGILSGSIKSVTATDAELFPDEIEEYTPEERKPRLVPKK